MNLQQGVGDPNIFILDIYSWISNHSNATEPFLYVDGSYQELPLIRKGRGDDGITGIPEVD
jgi:hypothetical protein